MWLVMRLLHLPPVLWGWEGLPYLQALAEGPSGDCCLRLREVVLELFGGTGQCGSSFGLAWPGCSMAGMLLAVAVVKEMVEWFVESPLTLCSSSLSISA